MKFKITKETIGSAVKIGGMALCYGLAAMASKVSTRDMIDKIRYSGNVSYSDAVGAIMESDMFDSYKKEAMELLKRNADSDYYKTVIKIVQSSMFSSYKLEAITNLNKEES